MKIIILYPQKKYLLDWNLILFWALSSIILIFSFYHQYIENIEPCNLCKWQRLIYIMVFTLSPIGLIQRFHLYIKKSLKLFFLIGFCLAFYHTLVQFEWVSDRCTIKQTIENINDFRQMLEQSKNSCLTVSWKLFGISASIYNMIISIGAVSFLHFISKESKENV